MKRTHGLSRKHPLYTLWGAMRQRCNNPNHLAYKWYGGRGIKVCERWADFRNFLADMGERPPGTSLDRINPNGNYEPGNCRWATPKQQANNLARGDHFRNLATTCVRGHPWDEKNTARDHRGRRRCRECLKLYRKVYRKLYGGDGRKREQPHKPSGIGAYKGGL